MKTIDFSPDLKLPLDTGVVQRYALVGTPGSGKSNGAAVLAEALLDAKAQVVVLDPNVGIWWSLRLAANGRSAGYEIPVLGGTHGDIPLEASGGATVADFLVDTGSSCVIDLTRFTTSDRKRFVTDFGARLLRRKMDQSPKTPMMVILEESQRFLPEEAFKDDLRMLHVWNEIAEVGRNHGIGLTLITQRPQAVRKSALNMTEVLILLRTGGGQERKAIERWVVEKGVEEHVKDAISELSGLKPGQAFVWSPSWLECFKRVRIRMKSTFDAGKTLKHGERGARAVEARALKPADLEVLRSSMAETVKRAEDDDPRALRRRIAELEKSKGKIVQMPARVETKTKPQIIEVPVFGKREQKRLDKALEAIETVSAAVDVLRQDAHSIHSVLVDARVEIKALRESKVGDLVKADLRAVEQHRNSIGYQARQARRQNEAEAAAGPRDHQRAMAVAREPRQQAMSKSFGGNFNGHAKLKKGARNMLVALKWFHPKGLTRERLGALAGVVPSSGTFRGYLSTLNTSGLIQDYNDGLTLTAAGQAMVADVKAVTPTSKELIPLWSLKLKKAGARRMFEYLTGIWPDGETREQVGHAAEVEPSSGTFRGYLSMLNTRDLVREKDGVLYASDDLFPEQT